MNNFFSDATSVQSGQSKLGVHVPAQFEDHGCTVWRVCWNITGTILASSGDDGCVRMFKCSFFVYFTLYFVLTLYISQ